MKRPPLAIIVLSVLLMAGGLMGLVGGFMNHSSLAADHYEVVWIFGVNVLALVAGIFMLRGRNWARWLAVAWMAFHVVISVGNPPGQLIMHAILLVLFAYGLFREEARLFFRPGTRAA